MDTNLEAKLGYKFRNPLLLAEALTHPSLAYEAKRAQFDNQRLEFLGDAVLQLALTERLFRMFPDFPEGRMTKLRARLVSRTALAQFAAALELGKFILLGKGEESSGGRSRASTLADAFEALIGAVYLDGGHASAQKVVLNLFEQEIHSLSVSDEDANPKGTLQELLQELASETPRYEIISQTGPDHCRLFVSQVLWKNEVLGQGSGNSKKEAEIHAAKNAITLRSWEVVVKTA